MGQGDVCPPQRLRVVFRTVLAHTVVALGRLYGVAGPLAFRVFHFNSTSPEHERYVLASCSEARGTGEAFPGWPQDLGVTPKLFHTFLCDYSSPRILAH